MERKLIKHFSLIDMPGCLVLRTDVGVVIEKADFERDPSLAVGEALNSAKEMFSNYVHNGVHSIVEFKNQYNKDKIDTSH